MSIFEKKHMKKFQSPRGGKVDEVVRGNSAAASFQSPRGGKVEG